MRIAIENIHAERAFLQAIETVLNGAFHHVAQELGAFFTGAKMRAFENQRQLGKYLLFRNLRSVSGNDGLLRLCVVHSRPHC